MTDITEGGKYYVPEIEEFHDGFEYEMNDGYMWGAQKFPNPWWNGSGMGGFNTLKNTIEGSYVRVKHLDAEDIVECGWTFDKIASTVIKDLYTINLEDAVKWTLSFSDVNKTCSFQHRITGMLNRDYDEITILNKSELKFIMKRLGITNG